MAEAGTEQSTGTPLSGALLKQIAIVTVVPVLVTIIIIGWQLFPQLKSSLVTKQQSIAELVAKQTLIYVGNASEEINILVSLTEQFPNSNLQNFFNAFVQDNKIFESIYLADEDGLIKDIAVIGTVPESARILYRNLDLSKSSMFDPSTMSTQRGWTKVFLSLVTGRLSTAYYRPTENGILIAELDINRLPRLSQELAKLDIIVMILDENHQLIAHPDPELSQMQINMSNIDLLQEGGTTEVFSTDFEWNNQNYFGTRVAVDTLGWSVIVAEKEEAVTGSLYQTLVLWLLSMGILLLAAIAFAYLGANKISARFNRLNEFSDHIAEGKYDQIPTGLKIEEFQKLSKNMITMSEAIQKRELSLQSKEQELLNLNSKLEARVEERTEELQTANEVMKQTVQALHTTMDQLVQAEKLASLGSLVAGIAHELNTPIGNANIASSTLGDFAKEIKEQFEEGSITKSSLQQFLDDALMATGITKRNLERASELISSFKQVAADQSSSMRREFSLLEIINEILLTLHPQTKKRPIEINVDIGPGIQLDSFPGPLGQVVSNLIINALVHGFHDHESGSISVFAQEAGEDVVIEVKDDGRGMPEEITRKVFDPFFTTKLGQGGSGLGLHICHNIVTEVLGGEITVSSEIGQGTQFTVRVPTKAPEVHPVSEETENE